MVQIMEMTRREEPSGLFKAWKKSQPFVLGGAAGMMATTCIQPIDMVKVRLQLQGEGVAGVKPSVAAAVHEVYHAGGIGGFYKGLGAALLRQATYTTARLGLFRVMSDKMEENYGKGHIPFSVKAGVGLVAGGLAAVFGTPADLVLLRMQADGTLPMDQRRNYKGVGDALVRIVREEGTLALWKGAGPTVVRAMAINMAMLASFDQAKEYFGAKYGPGFVSCQLPASLISGFLSSATALPFDFIKTRMQKQKPDALGKLPYKGPIDCTMKVLRTEGPMAFYKGFWTFYVRIAPHAMITLIAVDYLNVLVRKMETSSS